MPGGVKSGQRLQVAGESPRIRRLWLRLKKGFYGHEPGVEADRVGFATWAHA